MGYGIGNREGRQPGPDSKRVLQVQLRSMKIICMLETRKLQLSLTDFNNMLFGYPIMALASL
jgi:hypothetical protein